MMLVMVANVEGEPVQGAVVGISFLSRGEDVVLRNEVASNRVDRSSEDCTHSKVVKGRHSEALVYEVIEGKLDNPVCSKVPVRRELLDKHRTEGIETDLHHYPDSFAKFTTKKPSFSSDRHVCVNTVSALVGMVFQVVISKGHAVGSNDREVSEHTKALVGKFCFGG